MTQPNSSDVSQTLLPVMAPSSPLRNSQTRLPAGMESPSSSTSSLPYRLPSAIASSLFASTSNPGSRSASPGSRPDLQRVGMGSAFVKTTTEGAQAILSRPDDPRDIMLHAFIPHIAVHSSTDTDELMKEKGFDGGLWQLLRPYGEKIQGKVTIRDSIGANKICDDFAIRFVHLGDGLERRSFTTRNNTEETSVGIENTTTTKDTDTRSAFQLRTGGNIDAIEKVVDSHLTYAEEFSYHNSEGHLDLGNVDNNSELQSRFYSLYLRRLLSAIPMVPHETFSHPVACIIAISSRNASPIDALRSLYDESTRGDKRLPIWVNADYLRYYVLVHDEEKDDISKSTALFENMKRHFGLHCHLLRIRSSQCILTDDDAIPFPNCEWVSASEEFADITSGELDGCMDESSLCLYDSDATALRTFIREMVTQSVVPSMERCVSTWNDQVASRRRGIGGRMLNMTRKWTGFGSRSASTATATNYDTRQALYRPDTPEALMRKLADYAFMLRDWKLAQSTYDLCRSDYDNDKAWKYHAAANEMAAISMLMGPQIITSKARMETVDLMLESATYSYVTRCSATYEPLRCLVLALELLKIRGGSATDDAARWGARLLEAKLVGPVGDVLIKERIAACHATKKGTGSGAWGSRTRKAALWKTLAAHGWLELGKFSQAEMQLRDIRTLYGLLAHSESLSHFQEAHAFLTGIERELRLATSTDHDYERQGTETEKMDSEVEEESEALDLRSHRKSLMGAAAPTLGGIENIKLTSMLEEASKRDDNFV